MPSKMPPEHRSPTFVHVLRSARSVASIPHAQQCAAAVEYLCPCIAACERMLVGHLKTWTVEYAGWGLMVCVCT